MMVQKYGPIINLQSLDYMDFHVRFVVLDFSMNNLNLEVNANVNPRSGAFTIQDGALYAVCRAGPFL